MPFVRPVDVRRRSSIFYILGLALFLLIAQNGVNPGLPAVSETVVRQAPTQSPTPAEEESSLVVETPAPTHAPTQKKTSSTKQPVINGRDSEESVSSSLTARFRQDLALCEDVSEAPYLTDCDLTTPKRGIPVLWIGNSRTRSAYSWDILTSLASSLCKSTTTTTTTTEHPQGFIEALGAKSISEMRGLNEHPKEPGHCWIARVMCKLQSENVDTKKKSEPGKEPIRSAIFGTLWNPYLGAMKHK